MFSKVLSVAVLIFTAVPAMADHPYAGSGPQRCDLFDWVERFEPMSYRERYNRPRYLGGKIAYHISPTSQEAMSWHEHVQRGSYRNHAGRIVKNYYYPKPWEVLQVGARDAPRNPVEEIQPGRMIIEPPAR